MELVALEPGQILLDRGKIDYVYFPISGVVTKVVRMAGGEQIEAGMIGNEGMVPLCLFLGLYSTPFQATVQNSGQALRLTAKAFNAHVQPGQLLHSVLLRFTAVFMAQLSLSAACKRLHPLRPQYCRLLLMTYDRVGASDFTLTQAAAAEMLGVRRMSITAAARQLHDEGVINYRRGKIEIVDMAGLKKAACECYGRIHEIGKTLLSSNSFGTRGGKTGRR
jgi:CRP-like cAMP-binding protein